MTEIWDSEQESPGALAVEGAAKISSRCWRCWRPAGEGHAGAGCGKGWRIASTYITSRPVDVQNDARQEISLAR